MTPHRNMTTSAVNSERSPYPPKHELTGRSLLLRTFTVSDITEGYLRWLSDPIVNEHSQRANLATPITREEASNYLATRSPGEIILSIIHRQMGHVGNIKFGPIDWPNSKCDISILIGERSAWGRGIGREAVYLVTKYCFQSLGLNRVEAGTRNPAFIHLAQSIGWTVEGRARQRLKSKGIFWDHFTLGQLAHEFKEHVELENDC